MAQSHFLFFEFFFRLSVPTGTIAPIWRMGLPALIRGTPGGWAAALLMPRMRVGVSEAGDFWGEKGASQKDTPKPDYRELRRCSGVSGERRSWTA